MKIFIFCLFIFLQLSAIAQVDSSKFEVDTLYIQGPPIIIKKEYYLPSNDSVVKRYSWFMSGGYGFGTNLSHLRNDNLHLNYKAVSIPFVSAGLSFHSWSINIGISYLGLTGILNYINKKEVALEKNYTIIDTIDIYIQKVDGVVTTYYVTQNRDTVERYKATKDSKMIASTKSRYFLIPIQVKYIFKQNKWYVSPGINLSPGLSMSGQLQIPGGANSNPKKMVLFAAFNLGIGREISKKIKAEFYTELTKNIGPFMLDRSLGNLTLLTGGFRLNYIF